MDLPIRENIEFCQKKINNREIEIEKLIERKNNVIENYPNSINLNIESAYNDISLILEELELTKIKIEVPENNIFDEAEMDAVTEIVEEEIEEIVEEEIGSVSYVLSDGESMMNIAEKVYPSKDNWEAIYYFNKEAIDSFLVSNGLSSDFDTIKELANDTTLFTGIKLEIPTDYNYKI